MAGWRGPMVAAMTRLVIAAAVAAGALLLVPSSALAAWTWPLGGEVVTAFRNGADPYAAGQHRGIDIAGRVGAPVAAAAPGLVRFAGTAGSSGATVSVRSDDGRYDVSYLHLGSIAVRPGAHVGTGGAIGTVGMTGVRSADAPHLHFGVRAAGTRHAYVDPLTLLPPVATPRVTPPQAVPVPVAVPARPAPAPAPVPAPRAPGLRVPSPVAVRLPALAPSHAPAPAAPARPVAPAGVPALQGPRLGAPPAGRKLEPGRAREHSRPRTARSQGGTDIGWVAACAGLIATALALSFGRGGRRTGAGARPRAGLAALLPALAGRGPRTRE